LGCFVRNSEQKGSFERSEKNPEIEVGRGIKKAAALCAAGFGLFCSEFGAERIFRAQQEKS